MKALNSVKPENCEGNDRIPQRILYEGKAKIMDPVTKLFELIYEQKSLPEQWSISKIIPVFKKAQKPQ